MGLFFLLSVVSVSLTTIAVLYNEASASAREAQNAEKEAQATRRAEIKAAQKKSRAAGAEALRRHALAQKQAIIKLADRYEADLPEVHRDLNALVTHVEAELVADTTNLWRKQALRREYRRIKDAKARIDGYAAYLQDVRAKSVELFDAGRLEALMALPLPEARLPDDWLYVGKLVFVDPQEMDRPHARFNQKLHWRGPADRQQAIAMSGPDKTPVLVASQSKKNAYVFHACAARGRIEHSHIKAGKPLSMQVERVIRNGALCQAFDGLFSAVLPRHLMTDPMFKMLPGTRVSVHVSASDLLLSCNPFADQLGNGRMPAVEVSELPVQATGAIDRRIVFIEADESLLRAIESTDLEANVDRPFDIIDYAADSGRLSLCCSSVRLDCLLDRERGALRLDAVHDTGGPQVGSASGFDFKIVPQDLGIGDELGWPAAIAELEQRGRAAAVSPERQAQRDAQARLFHRWQQIVDFQLDYEHRVVETFERPLEAVDGSADRLEIPTGTEDGECHSITAKALVERIDAHEFHSIERCCLLEYWDSERGVYLPALSRKRQRQAQWSFTRAGLEVHARFDRRLADGSPHAWRLTVKQPFAPLDRQRRALDAFFAGNLVNPLIKDAILDPSNADSFAVGMSANKALQCHGGLNDSQRQAVEMALRDDPLCLIQGPPGTGKTSVIVEVVRQVLAADAEARLLIVSQQHVAIDNALERLVRESDSRNNSADVMRIGNPDAMSKNILPWSQDAVADEYIAKLIHRAEQASRDGDEPTKQFADTWRAQLEAQRASLGRGEPLEDELFAGLLGQRRVVGATCVGAAARSGIEAVEFDYVIIDEAGKSTAPELLIPLLRAKKAILIGDHHQLPPSIARILQEDSTTEALPFLRESFLDTSFFESLFVELPASCKTLLNVQYRMPPVIGTLVSDLFYSQEGGLRNGRLPVANDPLGRPLSWVQVEGCQKRGPHGRSLQNDAEANAIVAYLSSLTNDDEDTQPLRVAVITPYAAQRVRIEQSLRRSGARVVENEGIRWGQLTVSVDTVDASQGSEAELVCYSPVRTRGNLQFVHDRRRLNVACSRAKRQLVFFGNRQFLANWQPRQPGERNLFAEIVSRIDSMNA